MQIYTDLKHISIPSDILDISTLRRRLLLGIPGKKKRKKDWLEAWNQLQQSEATPLERQSREPINKNQIDTVSRRLQPWIGQCSSSELLAWRDFCYRNILSGSEVIELKNEFLLCQILC